jgi:hypothetical protein
MSTLHNAKKDNHYLIKTFLEKDLELLPLVNLKEHLHSHIKREKI